MNCWARSKALDLSRHGSSGRGRLGGSWPQAAATNTKSGVTSAEAETSADQAVAALADAVKTGWGLPSELKAPDFDALRARPDFQKLVAEVEAKAEKPQEQQP